MRALLRLCLMMALLLIASSLTPLATAIADPSASSGPSGTASDGASDGASDNASDGASDNASGDASDTASGSATPNPSPGDSGDRSAARAAVADPTLVTTITKEPFNPSTSGRAEFEYQANRLGVRFRCTLAGPGRTTVTQECNDNNGVAGSNTTGAITYTGLAASRGIYAFKVEAYELTPDVTGESDLMRWRIFNAFSPSHYTPRGGASFNRPLSKAYKRVNLTRMIRTINSMPGYKQAYPGLCPTDESMSPGTIRISLYSATDQNFAKSMVAAARRCISVQILMNNHLNRNNNPAWRRLENALGTRTASGGEPRKNFAHRCSSGCRGSGVLHTKMYLFNATMKDPGRNIIKKTVFVGSSNMTSNAARVQYNDLFAVRNRADLYATYDSMFRLMKRDDGVHRTLVKRNDPPYQTIFWPNRPGAADPEIGMLKSVHCRGANGGTGVRGRSIVYINMHAWFGTRGLAFANQVRRMYNAGCYVRVLYGFMSFGVFKKLRKGTGGRMSVRRTLFSHNGKTGYVYTHLKNISVSGYVGSDHSSKVAWTGSNNFTNDGTHFDEVMMRIPSASAYNAYVRQFKYMSKRKSSATYANFSEPKGGGRAPRAAARTVAGQDTLTGPAGTPTITSPEVFVDENGEAHALD